MYNPVYLVPAVLTEGAVTVVAVICSSWFGRVAARRQTAPSHSLFPVCVGGGHRAHVYTGSVGGGGARIYIGSREYSMYVKGY